MARSLFFSAVLVSAPAYAGPIPPVTAESAPAARPLVSAENFDAWLSRLTGTDAAGRGAAAAAVNAPSANVLAPLARRMAELKTSGNRDAMAEVLNRARKGQAGTPGKRAGSEDAKSFDWFDRVMTAAAPEDAAWRELAQILGMSRMLVHVGTTPAARELLAIYPGFGEFLRIDVERQAKAMGERAVAALIELRRGESKSLRPWASKLLDVLGKTVPGEAVQTADNQVLADVLRAYGRTKDADAARVIVSFANSDRAVVREAARDAVMLLAENGLWQLRDSYENLVGKKPPEDWGWEKTASELFAAYDKARLSEVYALMDEGLLDQKNGQLEAMASAFDRVLARAPGFERHREMAAGYVELAHAVKATDRARAMALLRKAAHIDPAGKSARALESEIAYLEGLDLASRGVVDEAAYRRALELDPSNIEAKNALDRIGAAEEDPSSTHLRMAVVVLLVLAAFAGYAVAAFWEKPHRSAAS